MLPNKHFTQNIKHIGCETTMYIKQFLERNKEINE